MADKRITTVDEMTSADVNADWLLVVRGTGQDLRRMRMNLLRAAMAPFDLHDDVDTELTSLHNADRILISDEGTPGAPQRFTTLRRLQSFFTNAFDLHDDVATELTAPADEDRLLISDEGENGDPQKWISVGNLKKSFGFLSYQVLPTEYTYKSPFRAANVAHTLGRPPVMVFPVLVCKNANGGYSVGDQVFVSHWQWTNGNAHYHTFVIVESSATHVTFTFTASGDANSSRITLPNKDNTSIITPTPDWWRVKAMIVG